MHTSGHNAMRWLPAAALIALAACGEAEKRYVPDLDGMTPTMSTADVTTFISDSGYTRYRIDAPLWLVYDEGEDPFWRFPDGLELEQYDTEMQPQANVACDSALYLYRRRLWRLDGTVVMVNTDRDSFLTQQLFWDQNAHKIYSDSFIHIVRSDRIIEGYGFESDENMRSYTVHSPTAILPVERRAAADSTRIDSARTDSMPQRRSAIGAPPATEGPARAIDTTGRRRRPGQVSTGLIRNNQNPQQ